MADKSIVDLPQLSEVTDATLIPVYQPNSDNPAQKMPSSVFRNWAEDAVFPAAKMAQEASAVAVGAEAGAKQAWTGVQNAIKNIPAGATPIVNDLTTGGAKMALSAEQGKVLGQRPNPNLLRNWYFRNPVNQRDGYVVPPGVVAYRDAEFTSAFSGTTQKYVKVETVTANYVTAYGSDGKTLTYVRAEEAVRGYLGNSTYNIDGWRLVGSAGVVLVTDNGLKIMRQPGATGSVYLQQVMDEDITPNVNHTGSIDVTEVEGIVTLLLQQNGGNYYNAFKVASTSTGVISGTGYAGSKYRYGFCISIGDNSSATIRSAKLELGSTQTLAHQENGVWVLNEISDKNKELLRCCMSTAISSDTYANNKMTAAAVNAVALDGSKTMTGNLYVAKNTPLVRLDDTANGGSAMMALSANQMLMQNIDKTGDDANRRQILLRNASHANGAIREALLLNTVIDNVPRAYKIYGEHNKPGGNYSGNGDATTRTVDTGGLGHVLVAYTSVSIALITYSGALCCNLNTGEVTSHKNAKFQNGVLTLTTAGDMVNYSGNTYNYQVL